MAPDRAPEFTYRTVISPETARASGLPAMQHAASILPLGAGRFLATWYAASYETAADAVLARASFTPADGWSAPHASLHVPGFSLGNPVLWEPEAMAARAGGGVPPGRTLQLFAALLPDPAWTSARVATLFSSDLGASWHDLRFLSPIRGLMTKGRPILSGARWLLPVYDEGTFAPMVLVSRDAGGSWELSGDTTSRGRAIQPCLVDTPRGVLMFTRSREGCILRSLSTDHGSTWSASRRTRLPNPNSAIDLIRLSDGRLCLVYNPTAEDRTTLALAFSRDEGERWTEPFAIQVSPGEVSYPSAAQDARGNLHVLYTLDRHTIVHATASLSP